MVLAQPAWVVGHYVEAYRFELPEVMPGLLVRIEAFYRWRHMQEVVREGNRLFFTRGSRWVSWFWPDKRTQLHQMEVSVADHPPAVQCEYTVFNWGPNVLIQPRNLEQEVRRLEDFLLSNAHRR